MESLVTKHTRKIIAKDSVKTRLNKDLINKDNNLYIGVYVEDL